MQGRWDRDVLVGRTGGTREEVDRVEEQVGSLPRAGPGAQLGPREPHQDPKAFGQRC